jgi:IS30 family transposase
LKFIVDFILPSYSFGVLAFEQWAPRLFHFGVFYYEQLRRRVYFEYDASRAQDAVNAGNLNKGARMLMTNLLAGRFAHYVLGCRLSPYDAVCRMRREMPGRRIPCVSTWYNHIAHGDIPVKYGQTPYHPSRGRPKRPAAHPAKAVAGRLQISDRPRGADERSEPGHYEVDTVVSCLGGRGGLLVLIDRMTRKYFIAPIGRLSQKAVNRALGRLVRSGALGKVRSITSDNGCEFLDPGAIGRITRCKVYYTRAYASYEKGSVENANRLVRRWYPKGTDFSKCSRAEIASLQETINSIHRLILGGLSANEFAASITA